MIEAIRSYLRRYGLSLEFDKESSSDSPMVHTYRVVSEGSWFAGVSFFFFDDITTVEVIGAPPVQGLVKLNRGSGPRFSYHFSNPRGDLPKLDSIFAERGRWLEIVGPTLDSVAGAIREIASRSKSGMEVRHDRGSFEIEFKSPREGIYPGWSVDLKSSYLFLPGKRAAIYLKPFGESGEKAVYRLLEYVNDVYGLSYTATDNDFIEVDFPFSMIERVLPGTVMALSDIIDRRLYERKGAKPMESGGFFSKLLVRLGLCVC